MTASVPIPDVDAMLDAMEAELRVARADLKDVARRSRAFLASAKSKRDEGLIAKLRRQLGLN